MRLGTAHFGVDKILSKGNVHIALKGPAIDPYLRSDSHLRNIRLLGIDKIIILRKEIFFWRELRIDKVIYTFLFMVKSIVCIRI